jgi:hypothetical protein
MKDSSDPDGRIAGLFARDRGPEPGELAAARLLLKRALAREQAPALRLADARAAGPRLVRSRAVAWIAQAAGFALLLALLAPLLPRLAPTREDAPTLAAAIASEMRAFGSRMERWIPTLPLRFDAPLPSQETIDRALTPIREIGDDLPAWWPSLHSDAR